MPTPLLEIDLRSVDSPSALRRLIAAKMQIPADQHASWERLSRGLAASITEPTTIRLVGLGDLERAFPEEARKLFVLFAEHNQRHDAAPCMVCVSEEYEAPVLFVQYECRRTQSSVSERAFVNCWVKAGDRKSAQRRAMASISDAGWTIVKRMRCHSVSRRDHEGRQDGRLYFEQALVDGLVCVFYEWREGGVT